MVDNKECNVCWWSLKHALAVAVYVLLVVWVMSNGENWFGKMDSIWGGFTMLMLLVLSASVCGMLVFGKPVMLYLDNDTSTPLGTGKKQAIKFLISTIGWLLGFVVLTMILLAVY